MVEPLKNKRKMIWFPNKDNTALLRRWGYEETDVLNDRRKRVEWLKKEFPKMLEKNDGCDMIDIIKLIDLAFEEDSQRIIFTSRCVPENVKEGGVTKEELKEYLRRRC